jgi:hypothetical protein
MIHTVMVAEHYRYLIRYCEQNVGACGRRCSPCCGTVTSRLCGVRWSELNGKESHVCVDAAAIAYSSVVHFHLVQIYVGVSCTVYVLLMKRTRASEKCR